MRSKEFIYLGCRQILAIILLIACFCSAEVVHLLHTSDTHGCCGVYDKTWLRLATRIAQVRRQEGANNTLLIDTGDAVQGSMLGSITQGKGTLLPIQVLPYDVFVPGNHEFDFGIDTYIGFCRALGEKLLSANLRIKNEPPPAGWRMFQRGGVKVAVIGIQASYYAHWLLPADYSRMEVESARKTIGRLMPEICRAKPNVIVLAIHQGWSEPKTDARHVNEVAAIAEEFPEIDVILGAHTHRTFEGKMVGHKPWYTQPGPYGQHLAVITIQLESGKIKNISSRLESTEESEVHEAPDLAKALQPYWAIELKEAKRDTGIYLTQEISGSGKAGKGCQTSRLLAQALLWEAKADVALHSKLSEYSLYPGKVKPIQLFRLVPYDNTMVTAKVTLKQLEEILAEQEKYKNTYRFCDASNIKYAPGPPLRILSIKGKKPDSNRRYILALNSHTAAGSGVFVRLRSILMTPQVEMKDSSINVRTIVEKYLKAHYGQPSQLPAKDK